MSDSGLEFEDSGYIPIGERPEWAGAPVLRPPPCSDEVVAIRTDPDHADLLAHFWAAMAAEERSQRVLALSEEIILNFNSAHFSVWAWRWECLMGLGTLENEAGVAAEAALLRRVATDNPKNYQLWNHRRKFALFRGAAHAGEELEFATACLAFDAKNYHAWAHRQAVVAKFGDTAPELWGQELAYTEHLLRDDIRNNSAWTQRYFVVEKAPPSARLGAPQEVYDREIDFAAVKISVAPHNEAAWGYFRALLRAPGAPRWAPGFERRVPAAAMSALEQDPSNVPALETLADHYAARAETLMALGDGGEGSEGRRGVALAAAVEAAVELFGKLVVADPARKAYYSRRGRDAAARFAGVGGGGVGV